MYQLYVIPLVLMACFGLVFLAGMAMIVLVLTVNRRTRDMETWLNQTTTASALRSLPGRRPVTWLAIRTRNSPAVQRALGLSHPRPCGWGEGLAADCRWLIGPPVGGWILVTGWGLPDPVQDVDRCFRFLIQLSRRLGHVQLFHAQWVARHHAWARLDEGCVTRAFAWAGQTLWNQGRKTQAEIELELDCPDYGQDSEGGGEQPPDAAALNLDKVPALAARWSLDPARIPSQALEAVLGVAENMRPVG